MQCVLRPGPDACGITKKLRATGRSSYRISSGVTLLFPSYLLLSPCAMSWIPAFSRGCVEAPEWHVWQVWSRAEGRRWVQNPQMEEELGSGVSSELKQDELRARETKG